MAYPDNKPTGNYTLRDYDFANLDQNKLPMDEYLFKNGYKNADESELDSVPDAHNQNWLFDMLHRNLRYTMGVAEENKKVLETKIATPTSIGQVKIGYGLEILGNGTLSVAKTVAEDADIISYDLPVGSYMLWAGNATPEYFIKPQGQTLLRSQYPALWEFAQSNNLVGTLFGNGNGSTTFTVTNIQNSLTQNTKFIPDYTKGVGVGTPLASSQFTAPNDGIYVFTGGINNSSRRVYVNGVATAFYTQDNADGSGWQSLNIPLKKGDKMYWSGGGTTLTSTFYPYQREATGTYSFNKYGLSIILKALPTPPSNAVPTGSILSYTGSAVPDGYIIPNGAEVSRTTFSNLYQWAVANNLIKNQSSIPNTPHAYYGSGNGSTTFTLPDLRGVFLKNADLASNRNGTALGAYQPINTDRVLVKKYVSGTNWYNLYSDGWIEQGGKVTKLGVTVTFLRAFSNTNYTVTVTNVDVGTTGMFEEPGAYNRTTTSMLIHRGGPQYSEYPASASWSACGYGPKPAVSEYTYKSGSVSITPILKY